MTSRTPRIFEDEETNRPQYQHVATTSSSPTNSSNNHINSAFARYKTYAFGLLLFLLFFLLLAYYQARLCYTSQAVHGGNYLITSLTPTAATNSSSSPSLVLLSDFHSTRPIPQHILVTGGTGYIGSHTVVHLLNAGYAVTIVDSLINSNIEVLSRIETITGGRRPSFVKADLREIGELEKVFKLFKFDACIHFAGLKAVGESVQFPLRYYDVNVAGTLNLLTLLTRYDCKRIVFSSSATVYGLPDVNPIPETESFKPMNPYGMTKLVIENILRESAKGVVSEGQQQWKSVILRYFNPIGAHPSGLIGEDPLGIPNNLLPFIMQVAVGRRPQVNVFGGDYDTPDGTGVRDYIHVEDLAVGHLSALEQGIFGDALRNQSCDSFNLGSGVGVSVMEILKAAEIACGKKIPYKIMPRRPGDIGCYYGNAHKANDLLKWKTTKTLQDAVSDSWKWQKMNPDGFAKNG